MFTLLLGGTMLLVSTTITCMPTLMSAVAKALSDST